MRARAPQYPRGLNRNAGSTSGKRPAIKRPTISKAGGASLVLLAILFWVIFYQNLPSNFGLNAVVTPENLGPEVTTANVQDRIIKMCMLAMSIFVMATRWSLTRAVAKGLNIGFAAFMVLIPLSAVWSFDSAATILRFISLIAIVLVCFAISLVGWHRHRLQQLTIPPLMFILVVSLLLGMVFPDRITELGDDLSQKGAWHGITLTKNQFGMAASLGVIICANRWLAREGRTSWAIVGAVIAFVGLILSRSNTSLLATMICLSFMVLVMRVPVVKQRYSTHVVFTIAGILLAYELVIQDVIPGAHTLMAPIRAMTERMDPCPVAP